MADPVADIIIAGAPPSIREEVPPTADTIDDYTADEYDKKVGVLSDEEYQFAPRVLTTANLSVIAGVIDTNSIVGTDPFSYGFGADFSIYDERVSVEELGFVAGANRRGEIIEAENFLAVEVLASASVGIGYIHVSTNLETGASISQDNMLFHYSTLVQEPSLGMRRSDISTGGGTWTIENPIQYSSEEINGFRNRFGADVTLSRDEAGYVAPDAIRLSIETMAQDLYTTYAVSQHIFPRTPPMKIRAHDIALLSGGPQPPVSTATTEALPGTGVTLTDATLGVTSPSSGADMLGPGSTSGY
tara:strand:+ start:2348 stop:3253 length:906 start_codon:yes stop_codon:yes gene_type:complete